MLKRLILSSCGNCLQQHCVTTKKAMTMILRTLQCKRENGFCFKVFEDWLFWAYCWSLQLDGSTLHSKSLQWWVMVKLTYFLVQKGSLKRSLNSFSSNVHLIIALTNCCVWQNHSWKWLLKVRMPGLRASNLQQYNSEFVGHSSCYGSSQNRICHWRYRGNVLCCLEFVMLNALTT